MIGADEIIYAMILFLWIVFLTLFITKKFYKFSVKRGASENVVVYYNRKIIHMLAGGFVAILVPLLFKTAILPFGLAMVLALLNYIPHKRDKLLYWYQTEDNIYEVHFCIAWGTIIALSWLIFEDFWFGVLPVLFLSIGDGVTGVVRNMIFGKRTKSWWGNLAMLVVCIPIGAKLGFGGMIAGAFSSFIEHFEYKSINDNIMIPISSFLLLSLFNCYLPGILTF